MESVSPNIFVNDIHATIEYYKKLGFNEVTSVDAEDGEKVFALMMNGTTTFMFQTFKSIVNQLPQINRLNGGSLLLYIKMKDIVAYFEKVKNEVDILQGLEKTFYGTTEFSVVDPNNFVLTFSEHD